MSDDKQSGGEPSMEEILTSIRQIISEDDESSSESQRGNRSADDSQPADEPGGDDEILELTDEVAPPDDHAEQAPAEPAGLDDAPEHGAAEERSGAGAGRAEAEPAHKAPAGDEGDDVPQNPQAALAAAAQAAMEDEQGESPSLDEDAEAPVSDEALGGAADDVPDADADTEVDTETAPEVDPSPEPEPARDPDPTPDPEPDPIPTKPAETIDAEQADNEPDTPAQPEDPMTHEGDKTGASEGRVTSAETREHATAALTELAKAAHSREFSADEPQSQSDRILEQLVRDALRPQLKAWLDENLPGLVERIVREEVRRITANAHSRAVNDDQDI